MWPKILKINNKITFLKKTKSKQTNKKNRNTYFNCEQDKKRRHDHHADILPDRRNGKMRVERNITHKTDEELS